MLILIFLMLIVLLPGLLKLPNVRGMLGEFQINTCARLSLDQNQYALIPDVTIPVAEGTSQIDHLIISEYGIFVIETKNMAGWIYGSEHDQKWMQVLYRYKKRFPNPIRQNYSHVCAISELLDVPREKIFPIVVFAGDATFKTTMPDCVFRHGEYISYIKSKTRKLFTRKEVLDLITKLFDHRLVPGWRTRRRHIENLRKRFGA